ncbi:exopolysaccharide biosynthesis polyprenyl glycosylphosphotransferase [Flavobacterium petrolei]|uniref:Exopolysaccharide biosynthesis polyprenyl glycosylphosphotransferase n=1 Tax=Flavobacterium petrolei TaxID=2259594 RepID=A0A482TT62_9FLAO|nr:MULTISPECIES: exopolysaccharide biosynthesis polyprenyl glycosylphosphotransferase [Flavobacterium]QIH38953.1 exopolysaccharide biosynthesis polyprenyl glycosylphosphotransferase [Flavobacterium sp. Sr18]RYJ53249.1 exopolysaccharide biosynthesis polyprenyl glycosylphosphotransferase [Flavobacterium petrolei]
MKTKTGRYSGYIRPFSFAIDLLVINVLLLYMTDFPVKTPFYFVFISISWFVIAANLGFYEVYRYTKVISILNCALKQGTLFTLFCLALAFYESYNSSFQSIGYFTMLSLLIILIVKLSIYYFLKKYRLLYGGNFRKVILIGNVKSTDPLQQFFTENPDYGYKLERVFELENNKSRALEESFDYVLEHQIDELYCSMSDLNQNQINEIVFFADNNLKTLKFIPSEKQILSHNFTFEYYNYIPVISLRNILLDDTLNKVIKRVFDIVFSLLIILGVLSWLTPILAVFIKFESKGPLFFIQKRNGLNYKEFFCYKFRSMELNDEAHLNQVSKNDNRVTTIGRFIRKTSIDELPQFFNVLMGEMSVVGPRPHMVSHTRMYALTVDKFMVRHFIKPGITGLAQTKGFRGEVEADEDIINRVKYDIFYMENWSLILDLKIIFQTVINIFKGEEKAY